MFVALQENIPANTQPTTDDVSALLAGLGFDAEVLDIELELAIEEFSQWSNPRDAAMLTSSGDWHDTDDEPERVK